MITPPPSPRNTQAKAFRLEGDRFLNLSLDIACVIGKNGYFQYLNSRWEEILGHPQAELMARPYWPLSIRMIRR